MGEVIRFPPGTNLTPEQAVQYALDEIDDLEDVLVLGFTKKGELYCRCSEVSREWSLWLLLEFQDYIRKVGRYA